MWRKIRNSLVVIAVLLSGVIGFSQSVNSGDIRGTVTDPSGAVIPGVTVTVLNLDTGVSKEFSTNQDGVYDTSSILTGNYKVTFLKDGFGQFVRGPITIQVGFTTLNAQLQVGSSKEQVVVTTDVPLLHTESGDQVSTLPSKEMAQLPQTSQNWENFMILLPGTAGVPGGSQGASNPGQVAASNGNLPYSNVLADGASTTLSHSQNANPAVFETVSELQVSLSSFSAQYGIGGMIINQITKGGTSKFHGSAYDYLHNNALNAAQYGFGDKVDVPFSRYNNFGGTIGGPILKKRMFFFFDYDQTVDHGSANNSTQTVPTEAVLKGDFTGQRILYDPTTQTYATDSKGNRYPVRKSFLEEYGSNAIPQSMVDGLASKFQQFYPTPSSHIAAGRFVSGTLNSVGLLQNNWYSSVPQSTPYRKFFGRLDFDVTPNNRITMSDTQSDTPVIYPSSVTACPVNCQSGDVDNNNAQITDVWNISASVINEARLGYTWQGNFFQDLTLGKGYVSKLGWQYAKADTIPAIQFYNTFPYAWIQPQSNSVYKEHVFDPSDVVTMIRGKHILHFGGELLIYRDNSTAWGNTNAGSFRFTGQYTQHWSLDSQGVASADSSTTGVEYADFLLGLANHWDAGVTPEYGARLKSPQMFIQDDFKMRPNLTINLGLRYQINHGWNETHGNMDSFDPTVTNPVTGTLGAEWYGSTHANGRKSLQADVFNTILPRVGFSWAIHPDTTLRGGFGLYSYNWSLDNYGSGMGHPFGSSGSVDDQSNGITPVVQLGSAGTGLPYTASSTDPTRFNNQNSPGYNEYHTPVPKIYQWNLAVQRQIGTNLMAELSYVASHGFNLPFPTDLNAIPVNKLVQNAAALGYRPYPQYDSIPGNMHNAISNYHSLQASIMKRMSSGLSFGFNYVWSHFLDDQDSSGWGSRMGPQDYQIANNPSANYSNSNFDVRNAFKGQIVYQLPFGRGKMFLNTNRVLDELIGGWQLASTMVIQTGQPFNVFADGNTYQLAGRQFPNWSGLSPTPKHRSARCMSGSGGCVNQWYDPAAFTKPADGTFGNVRRNSLYGPGIEQVNLSGGKTFTVWEGVQLQVRVDASNAFNHPSFGQPTGTLTGAGGVGGQYSWYSTNSSGQQVGSQQISGTTVGGRTVQLGARLSF